MSDKGLPPLTALRAFELSARLGSFTHAARRLGGSQSSVTRQVAILEASLGMKLFHRGRRGVELTTEGRDYLENITPAFAMISAATDRIRRPLGEEVLRLRVYPVFAVKWLIPRLAEFRRWAPQVSVELDTQVEPVDFQRSALDAAIQFGARGGADHGAERLIDDEIEPVCSPALLASMGGRMELADLQDLNLIQAYRRKADWRDWAQANGVGPFVDRTRSNWPSSLLAYQAAEEGLGVAIGQTALLRRDLERGRLVRPFNLPLRRPLGYFLVLPPEPPPLRVRQFRAWLHHALAQPGHGASTL